MKFFSSLSFWPTALLFRVFIGSVDLFEPVIPCSLCALCIVHCALCFVHNSLTKQSRALLTGIVPSQI